MIAVRRLLPAVIATLMSASVLAGCGESATPPEPQESAVESPTSDVPTSDVPTPDAPPTLPSPQGLAATADLAEFLGVKEIDIEVVSAEEVTWSDGSRGCAEEGMMYTQAQIEGSRMTLRHDGTDYEYHSGGSEPPVRCDKPTE